MVVADEKSTFQLGKRKARSLSRFLTLPVKNRTCHFDGIRLSTFDCSPWGDHEASVPIAPVPQVSTHVRPRSWRRPPQEPRCEATAPQRRRQGACEDSDVLLSGHTWPTR